MKKIELLLFGLAAVLANCAMAFDLNAKKAFVCDLDGTLFVGAEPIRPAIVAETFDGVDKVPARGSQEAVPRNALQ